MQKEGSTIVEVRLKLTFPVKEVNGSNNFDAAKASAISKLRAVIARFGLGTIIEISPDPNN